VLLVDPAYPKLELSILTEITTIQLSCHHR